MKFKKCKTILLVLLVMLSACARPVIERGKASYYADKFNGRKTASGEIFRNNRKTAAHKTLPFGTRVKVTNLKNGRSVIVRINDRGPFVSGRIIDVSQKSARKLGMLRDGIAEVRLRYKKRRLL